MLWLGFSGTFVVNVPDSIVPYYNVTNIKQHDRLTISDTSNTVRWYIKREDISVTGEIQDPQWSTHPDYIACLGKDGAGNWDGYVVRISDKAFIKFCEDKLIGTATPHVWLPDSVTSNGIVTSPAYDINGIIHKASVEQFFGTTNVKLVYSTTGNGLTIFYVDFNDSIPQPIPLIKPETRENWDCVSPIISPDGNWIAYNCINSIRNYPAYIQRLKPDRVPVFVSEEAADPQWWINRTETGNPYYLIYTLVNEQYFQPVDLADQAVEKSGSAGLTLKQKLKGSSGDVPAHMGLKVDVSSPAETIARLPFKGGLSRNGRFLCTGYAYGYILDLK